MRRFPRFGLVLAAATLAAVLLLRSAMAPALASPGEVDATFGGGVFTPTVGDATLQGTALVADVLPQTDGKTVVAGTDGSRITVARYLLNGAPDQTWGTSGIIRDDRASGALAVVLQDNGRVVVAAAEVTGETRRLLLARYMPNGALDTTFGAGGHVVGAEFDSSTAPLAILPDGKLLVAGDATLYRFNPNGSADPTFGIGGNADAGEVPRALALQPDGKIVTAFLTFDAAANSHSFNVSRFLSIGLPDLMFGPGGTAAIPIGFTNRLPAAVLVQPDGRIVTVGAVLEPSSATHDFVLTRWTAAGVADCTFGVNGLVRTQFPPAPGTGNDDDAMAAVIQPDGRIVVAGRNTYGLALARYTANGHLDPAFGEGGATVIQDDPSLSMGIKAAALTVDDKLVVAGDNFGLQPGSKDWVLGRFLLESGPAGVVPAQTACNPTNPERTVLSGPEDLGGVLVGGPDAAAWSANRLDVFVRGTDNALHHRWWDGAAWRGWESLGGVLTSDPTVAAWSANRLDVFVRGSDNALHHRWYDGARWRGWESLGGVLTSEPEVAAWSANRLDVFVRGTDNALHHRWWDGGAWRGWESLGGALTSGPAATSISQGTLDVFALGTNNALTHKTYGGTWGGWASFGGAWRASPDAAGKPGFRDWVVSMTGTDNGLWTKDSDYASGRPTEAFPGQLTSGPAIARWSASRLDLFFRAADQHLWHGWRS